MKKTMLMAGALIAGFAFAAPDAHGQIGINLGAGPSLQTGEGAGGIGYHVAGGFRFGAPGLPIAIRPEAMFQQLPDDHGNQHFWKISANAEAGLPLGFINPYVIGGLGIYQHEERHEGHTHDPHNDWGFNIGLGTRFGLAGLNAYAEARYHQLFTENGHNGHGHAGRNAFIPITVGVMF